MPTCRLRSFTSSRFFILASLLVLLTGGTIRGEEPKVPKIAVICTVWYLNNHVDNLAGRILQGPKLDGSGPASKMKLVSAYVDQTVFKDISAPMSQEHGFKVCDTITEALTLGTDQLAVDGVMLIAEHGDYPESETGSVQYPKRRFFEEVVQVFEAKGKVVPVFFDKHLSDNAEDIAWIWSQVNRLKIPFMAGSSLPITWRYPQTDVSRTVPLKEIVVTSYHRLDAYGIHAIEIMQALAEQRPGGEVGIKQVRCLEGDAVWEAADKGMWDEKLLDAAAATFIERPIPAGKKVRDLDTKPVLFLVDYADGLRASVITMKGRYVGWAAAWRDQTGKEDASYFWVHERRPYMHFSLMYAGIEKMMLTGKPTWPAERTVLTSGVLDAALRSKMKKGEVIATPQMLLKYQPEWRWSEGKDSPRFWGPNEGKE